ncbi:growth factor receptor-bound protein 14-like [Brevipalpus obovatus]|uniref:growth factor receptor-bound protein 14-like n=1 Tax=Brevipalpus obovatus TaxID=246614 RepID=UPI003D9F4049
MMMNQSEVIPNTGSPSNWTSDLIDSTSPYQSNACTGKSTFPDNFQKQHHENDHHQEPQDSSQAHNVIVNVNGFGKHEVMVDENLTVADLVHLMMLKLGIKSNSSWNLIIRLPEEKMERILEDWEEVLIIYRRFLVFRGVFSMQQNVNINKYKFFEDWSSYFPSEMIYTCNGGKDKKRSGALSISFGSKNNNTGNKLNDIQTQLSCFDKLRVQVKCRLLMCTSSMEGKYVEVDSTFDTDRGVITCSGKESSSNRSVNVKDYYLFTSFAPNNAENSSDATKYGFCLISEHLNAIEELTTIEPLNSTNYGFISDSNESNNRILGSNDVIFFSTDSLEKRNCWAICYNLTKYGLHEYRVGYHEFKRRVENLKNSIPPTLCESTKEKVLLNYSHENGPLIIDETPSRPVLHDRTSSMNSTDGSSYTINNNNMSDLNGKTITNKSASSSTSSSPGNVTPKLASNCSPSKYSLNSNRDHENGRNLNGEEDETHLPWYYPHISHDDADRLLGKYQNVDGVFLVRSSSRDTAAYVLSFVCKKKVVHCQIKQMDRGDTVFLSLDYGSTRFYGLKQLIEFYQLNETCLPTKLTHFLVHRPHSSSSTTSID